MENYDSLVDAISGLRKEGYTKDFNLKQNCLICGDSVFQIFHDEFIVDKYFRFEGQNDPDDQSIIYAISSLKHNVKGILINGYGTSTDEITDEMLATLSIKHQ